MYLLIIGLIVYNGLIITLYFNDLYLWIIVNRNKVMNERLSEVKISFNVINSANSLGQTVFIILWGKDSWSYINSLDSIVFLGSKKDNKLISQMPYSLVHLFNIHLLIYQFH